ncbi:DUF4166 domain-containing protein [Leifsonia sp. Leaf264]|uniref:DUF4166 domain-containing protein n=1 Tax=Leifsonia sp. Leaf264 TaxID=1736314 RepID=UPI0006F50CEB|nr:DUF4166 domain-containing protein [Leifsonia sp. Leaf264]KQO99867.1 hypothetical protein ASF30_08310 [Leifsonia sp. Leaf264]
MGHPLSPYERALGDAVESLHPRLRAYFAAVPVGRVGRGAGVFDVVGTPRRWTWPVLALLGRSGVVFPVWERDVAFTVENRATATGAITARRTFELAECARTMVDRVAFTPIGIVDELGGGRLGGPVRAAFDVDVSDGALVLQSTRVGVRLAGLRIELPRCIAPSVRLVESFDDASERQRVAVTIDLPVIGRVYEYSGSFRYGILKDSDEGER